LKFCPPGAEPFQTLQRIDGWFGSPEEVPESVARLIVGEMPSGRPRTVAEATRARMIARQLKYEYRGGSLWRGVIGSGSKCGNSCVM
jgi:hypothetical protein